MRSLVGIHVDVVVKKDGATDRSHGNRSFLDPEFVDDFGNEAVGDLCYYAPWGNLVMFYASYRWSRGLLRLGRLDDGIAPLMMRGEFPLRVEALSSPRR